MRSIATLWRLTLSTVVIIALGSSLFPFVVGTNYSIAIISEDLCCNTSCVTFSLF